MSTARDELQELADESSYAQENQSPPQASVKDDVREAIEDYALEQYKAHLQVPKNSFH